MAVGKAGEPADRDRLAIRFGDVWVAKDGLPVDGYDETPVAPHLTGQDVRIGAALRLGGGRATGWAGDQTHGYNSTNADFRSKSPRVGQAGAGRGGTRGGADA